MGAIRTMSVGLALAMLATACASDDEPSAGQGTSEESSVEETSTVMVASSDLGSIVVDGEGMTLYVFEADTGEESTCYEECAATWPAMIDEAPTAGEGIDESLLGTTERTDGSTQITYAGQPLYHFASDQAAGDTEGQGVGDVWFVVDPAGEPVKGKPSTGRGY